MANEVPKISVIVPTYNDAEFLAACLDSLLAQTLPPMEIVICDDASSDGTREIIQAYVSRHPDVIRALFHDANIGCARNFNSGIQASNGDYVSLVAGDDYWLPEKLQSEIERLGETGFHWAFSKVALEKDGERTPGLLCQFNFEYFNSTSAKYILDIFKSLNAISALGIDLEIKWLYEEDDEDMLEVGQEMSRMSKLPFEYIKSDA